MNRVEIEKLTNFVVTVSDLCELADTVTYADGVLYLIVDKPSVELVHRCYMQLTHLPVNSASFERTLAGTLNVSVNLSHLVALLCPHLTARSYRNPVTFVKRYEKSKKER